MKNTSTIKVANIEITDNFHYEKKPSLAYHQIDTFHLSMAGTQGRIVHEVE